MPPVPDSNASVAVADEREDVVVVTGDGGDSSNEMRRRALLGIVIGLLMVLPALVAIVCLVGRRWYPTDDLAIIDLRVRDVWSAHPPLTGLYSRPGWNHPGPIVFDLLALLSAAADQAAWATRVGGALLQAIALVWLAWVTWKRGLRMLLAAATVTSLAYLASGPWLFRQPWNLYTPIPYFLLFIFLTCIVATGSFRQLIAMTIAATVIVQTHVGYTALIALGFGWAIGWTIVDARRTGRAPDRWRSTLIISGTITALCWLPPVIDALTNSNGGNLGKLARYFSGSHTKVGMGRALGIMAAAFRLPPPWLGAADHLAPFTHFAVPASDVWLVVPCVLLGLGFLAVRRTGSVVDGRMLGFAAALLVVGVFAISQADEPRAYTFQWRVVVAAFVVVTSLWSIAAALAPRVSLNVRIAAACVIVGVIAWGTIARAASEPARPNTLFEQWEHPLQLIMHQLDGRGLPANTPVRVRFYGVGLPSMFDGIVNELDRAGVDIRVDPSLGRVFGSQRVIARTRPAETWYVIEEGSFLPNLVALPRARVIARTTPLSPTDDAELTRLQQALRRQLERSPRPELAKYVDQSLIALAAEQVPGVDESVATRVAALDDRVERSRNCRCAVVSVPANTGAPDAPA
jgi:hypothetical protein